MAYTKPAPEASAMKTGPTGTLPTWWRNNLAALCRNDIAPPSRTYRDETETANENLWTGFESFASGGSRDGVGRLPGARAIVRFPEGSAGRLFRAKPFRSLGGRKTQSARQSASAGAR